MKKEKMIMVEKTLESSLGYRAILRLGKWDKDLYFFLAGRAKWSLDLRRKDRLGYRPFPMTSESSQAKDKAGRGSRGRTGRSKKE